MTNSKGNFVPDTLNYDAVGNDGEFCISFNKSIIQSMGTVKINLPIDGKRSIDTEYLNLLQQMVYRMVTFKKTCSIQLDTFINAPHPKTESEKIDLLRDAFMIIACCAKNTLFDNSEHNNVRVHFRVYNGKEHEHFCATIGDRKITPIKWNNGENLIFHAFNNKRALVKSQNPKLYFDTKGEWKDFLTVPVFYELYKGKQIPKYGFGISIKGCNDTHLTMQLEILSFLRIEELINSIIFNFDRNYLQIS